jgi:cupin 2 domain-containing protein
MQGKLYAKHSQKENIITGESQSLCNSKNNCMNNIFNLPSSLRDRELFESIVSSDNILIERIISTGQTTPKGKWYDQEKDEWVILLQGFASLVYDNGKQIKLTVGDYLFIPAHQKHRVEYTSSEPPCIWLAIHGDMNRIL